LQCRCLAVARLDLPVEQGQACGGASEAPGHADQVAAESAAALDQFALLLCPTDDSEGHHQDRCTHDITAQDCGARVRGELLAAAHQLERLAFGEAFGQAQGEIGLAGLCTHRRQIR
jgi:hypothetical protein